MGKIKNALKLIKDNPQLKVGIVMLILLLAVAILSGVLAPYDPYFMSDEMTEGPSALHKLGTDHLGRDVLSMIIYGTKVSLAIGFVSAMIAGIIGTLLGGIAGYVGGICDTLVGEFINVFMMMPSFFLVLIVIALFGSGMMKVMIVIGLTSWVGNAKLMRAQALSLRDRTFIKSAEAVGESKFKILFKHIIPNGIFPIIANTTMGVASAILTESSLAFLGLGDPNVISWGQIIQNGKGYLVSGWWVSLFAGLAIIYTVITFYLIGDGLNRVLSPKLRRLGKEG